MVPFTSPSTLGTMTFMDSILDHRSPTTDRVFKTSIALSTHPSTPTIEPLPYLDYFLINQLITLGRPHLNRRELKRIDYFADARRSFYMGHHKFQVAYRDLLDAYACAEILDKNFEGLSRQLADTLTSESNGVAVATIRRQLCTIEIQRRSNNEDMRICLDTLRVRTKNRQYIAAWYSNLKVLFLKDEMPGLMALGKQSYDWAMRQRATMDSSPALSTLTRTAIDRVDSDHCSDSGGTSTADVEMQDSGFEMSVNEGEEEGLL